MKRITLVLLVGLCVLPLAFAGCGEGDDDEGSHTVALGGVGHADGYADPLAACAGCHGAALKGGDGPSCYDCHAAAGHGSSRGGRMHMAGVSSLCQKCHGPGNAGGLGPACATCH